MYEYTQRESTAALAAPRKTDLPFSAAKQRTVDNPYAGIPLYLSAMLADRVRDSFGIDAGALSLRESPEVAEMGARATAQGDAIRFAPGAFSPDTYEGLSLLGHELAHVREQAGGGIHANVAGTNLHYDAGHEARSDSVGKAFANGSLGGAQTLSLTGIGTQSAPIQLSFDDYDKVWGKYIVDSVSDKQGREILHHYLHGKGQDFIKDNDQEWTEYMEKNPILIEKVRNIVHGYYNQAKYGETTSFNKTMHMEIENGELAIGYQFLHGTKATVGGFNITGTIEKDASGEATIAFIYTWNDIMNPNPKYISDKIKARIAKDIQGAEPTEYYLRISWLDVSTTDMNGNFDSGWLEDTSQTSASPQPGPSPVSPAEEWIRRPR